MLKTVIVLPVLLFLFLGVYEVGLLMYYRAQVRSAATAAALAAVGTQKHIPIPIPTEFVEVPPIIIPVNGYIVNTLHLPNVDTTFESIGRSLVGLETAEVRGEATAVARLTNPAIRLQRKVLPWPGTPLPFKYVEITAEVDPPKGVFTQLVGSTTISHSACAIAWVRPDYWVHGWWDERTLEVVETFFEPDGSLPMPSAAQSAESSSGASARSGGKSASTRTTAKAMSSAAGEAGTAGKAGKAPGAGVLTDEPLRFYRLTHCGVDSLLEIVEVVAEAHFAATGQAPDKEKMRKIANLPALTKGGALSQQMSKSNGGNYTPDLPVKDRNHLVQCIDAAGDCFAPPPSQYRCPGSDAVVDLPEPVIVTLEDPSEALPTITEEEFIRQNCPPTNSSSEPSP